MRWNPVDSPYRVPFDGSFSVTDAPTKPPDPHPSKKASKARLKEDVEALDALQEQLYAEDRRSVLMVFQAMDAAGKDSTIRAVLRGLNPAGCQVFSFKQPSSRELDHDFLWRTAQRMPERGRIGIFNRSYYEEVLVVRVHPEYLGGQRLPPHDSLEQLWEMRYESIRDHELHLARSGTRVLKFFLRVSPSEQRKRFLRRIERPEKNWKFSDSDLAEAEHWADYMKAYEDALNATSRPWAPWYAIPADDKPFMRAQVAQITRASLEDMDPRFPVLSAEKRAGLATQKRILLERMASD
jgi:PPK2 family polyphosphate:nucleotide phosphotransferase